MSEQQGTISARMTHSSVKLGIFKLNREGTGQDAEFSFAQIDF
jgi:hypothetical protein